MTASYRVALRRVREDDADLLLALRNDPDAVRFSITGEQVSRKEHERWFATRRADPDVHLWIAEEDGVPVAQVRVDVTGTLGVVSVAVSSAHRGRGLGSEVLRATVDEMRSDARVTALKALIHPGNPQSLRAFENAGFHLSTGTENGFSVLERSVARSERQSDG